MSDTIIKVENLSIRFNLYKERVDSLKEYFIKMMKGKLHYEEFLALQDISFEIKQGESFALMGKNGSGKSTLLKVLAGVLKPFRGKVEVHGAICPLIELGVGFDMELTAKENIFLNGAILGHSRRKMMDKFDEIIDFSELHDFMDVPVKNFSSGMVSRLGFSIATALEADILAVDEVLSVGDIRFQKKCEEKIGKMLKNGTTLLFVSHNSEQVTKLCKRGLWLQNGRVVNIGSSKEISEEYLKSIS